MILGDDGVEIFDALQNRLHPAESRVNMLAEKTPAIFRAFDLLAVGKHSALDDPFSERRAALAKLIDGFKRPRVGRAHAPRRRSRRGRAVARIAARA